MAYVKFVRFDIDPHNETSISHLIRLNAFITDSVDFFSQFIDYSEMILKEDRKTLPRENFRIVEKDTTEKKNVYGGGGKLQQASSERFRSLLPFASSHLLSICKETFYEGIGQKAAHSSFEMKLSFTEIKAKRIGSSKRNYTIVFKYPTNCHIYIALNCRSFSEFICG